MDGRRTGPDETGPSPSATEPAGTRRGAPRIVADYELRERLTRYPHADAFLATHRPTGAPRLLYVLRPAGMQDHALVHRAALEVDAARWLRHPAIPALDPCGETPEGRLYVAVAHREGRSLGALVAEQGQVDPARLVRAATQAVEALDEAHAVGLVHGRITPASIVLGALDDRGREAISLVGLGTAAATSGEITQAMRPFTSPEQLAGADPDARSDVYALASVLQLALDLDGRPAHELRGSGVSTPADVIAIALSADPAARYPGVKAFWEELLGTLVRKAGAEASSTARITPAVSRPGLVLVPPADVAPIEAAPFEAATIDVAPSVETTAVPATAPTLAPIAERPRVAWARIGRRRIAVGLVAAGFLVAAATGLARTVDRRAGAPGAESTTPPARQVAASGGESRGAGDPASAASAMASGTTPARAPEPAAAQSAAASTTDRADSAPVAALRVAKIVAPPAIPELDVAPTDRERHDVVHADEFAVTTLGEPATVSAARRVMERAIAAFASALESRDMEALRRAAPDMPADRRAFWAGVFRDALRVRAELTVLEVRLGDHVIVADVRSRVTVQNRGAAQPMHSDAVLAATLVREGDGWRLQTTR